MTESPEDPTETGPVTAPDGSTIYDDPHEPEGDDTEELDMDEEPDHWLDSEDLYEDIDDDEAEEGRLLGEQIDTADDEDAGG